MEGSADVEDSRVPTVEVPAWACTAAACTGECTVACTAVCKVDLAGRSSFPMFVHPPFLYQIATDSQQLPFSVGWQDLKDLFRQAGE